VRIFPFARLLVAVLPLSLGGCTLNPAEVEKEIRDKLEKDDVGVDKITCPSKIPRKSGGTFDCEGESSLGDDFKIHVKQTDGAGSLQFEIEGRVLDPEGLEEQLEELGATDPKCGKKRDKLVAVEGTTVKCSIGGQDHTLTFTNSEGDFEIPTSESCKAVLAGVGKSQAILKADFDVNQVEVYAKQLDAAEQSLKAVVITDAPLKKSVREYRELLKEIAQLFRDLQAGRVEGMDRRLDGIVALEKRILDDVQRRCR
jgi:hypothetical protein